jgi:hypothetical protein
VEILVDLLRSHGGRLYLRDLEMDLDEAEECLMFSMQRCDTVDIDRFIDWLIIILGLNAIS